ncbi:MAG: DUF2905 domain-containing protein [Chloroflexota bacterium]
MGRILMLVGGLVFLVGGGVYLIARLGLPLGRLPGDIVINRDNLTCVFPLATSLLISLVLTVVLNLVARYLNR